MALDFLKDINLAVCILKLYQPVNTETNIKKISEQVFQDYFINFGTMIRDPWLVIFGYLSQGKTETALDYVLTYDNKSSFENNKQILENIDEISQNLDCIRKIFGINSFDYKLLIFARNLEKLYQTSVKDIKQNVKSQGNTNFDDIWDMDEDDQPNTLPTTSNSNHIQEISINYDNLSTLCLTNSLHRGIIFAPIMNFIMLNKKTCQLEKRNKELIKNLICDRIALDIQCIEKKEEILKYFTDIEGLFDYLEKNKILERTEIFKELNKVLIWMDDYYRIVYPCLKGDKYFEDLNFCFHFTEKLVIKNLDILIDFNFADNINLNKVSKTIIKKIKEVVFFLINTVNKETKQNKEESFKYTENINLFKIAFIFHCYILFLAKTLNLYDLILTIYNNLKALIVKEFDNLINFNINFIQYILFIEECILKIDEVINSEEILIKQKEEATQYFMQILNISIIDIVKQFLINNFHILNITQNKKRTSEKLFSIQNNPTKDSLTHSSDFKFVSRLIVMLKGYVDNFEENHDKYIRTYMPVNLLFQIHSEFEIIYMKNLAQEDNYYKYSVIPIKTLFVNQLNLKAFEETFSLKHYVTKHISTLLKNIKYEKKQVNNNDPSNNTFNYEDNEGYSLESVKVINEIFETGIEVAKFPEGEVVSSFSINNCDPRNMALGFKQNGHKKINLLFNLLIRKRTDSNLIILY